MEMYEVGGCVRDELLGIKSKDIDFSVVFEDGDLFDVEDPFRFMVEWLENLGFKIFLETPEHLTVRAQFPKQGSRSSGGARNRSALDGRFVKSGITADFVLARKEGTYTDGRRPDYVEVGTLEDDLARRDFTMNAIAKDRAGNLIDPFDGQTDIENKVIRAVGDPMDRFDEDALRMLRAIRFKVTKGFSLDHDIMLALNDPTLLNKLAKVSDERKMDELSKMLRFDTLRSLDALEQFKGLRDVVFSGRVSLDATMKQKGRGR